MSDCLIATVEEYIPHGTFDSIIRFECVNDQGIRFQVAVDHRMAQPILEHLEARREDPDIEAPVIGYEPWQVLA